MSFLEQTPGESFVMMPVMTYCAVKATSWATGIALVVTGSVTKCLMTDPISSHSDTANVSYGLLLLLGCILMDLHFRIPAGNLKAMSSRYWAPPRSCRARSSLRRWEKGSIGEQCIALQVHRDLFLQRPREHLPV